MADAYSAYGFNPRLREGGDASKLFSLGLFNCFNPRLREGGDWRM